MKSDKEEIRVHTGYVPRMAFILWMTFKMKLLTRSRLKECRCIQNDLCVLWNNNVEDINHLFFTCIYSKMIWREVLRRNGVVRQTDDRGMGVYLFAYTGERRKF